MGFIVVQGFAGVMRSLLIRPALEAPIRDPDDVVESGKPWGLIYEFVDEEMFETKFSSEDHEFWLNYERLSWEEDIYTKVDIY